ncbi:BON domain-containing protein [Rhizobium sp. P38BS-XIX]|uniref:BON domain-containing protein n=1 Tax=Rhizobium sp. P38BS-XIX TaxID=2726740 RepID=UPI001457203E|nr:BON domain-containing protein [Rhizobium sp. P38BS-XIX]NLR97554.1 BON domain-containing protein [Rhizobium sp. P38BS-XIX]
MVDLKSGKAASPSEDGSVSRTVQALDQAAGGLEETRFEPRPQASQDAPPEPGTDDARCEDTAEYDAQRQQQADEISLGGYRMSLDRLAKNAGATAAQRDEAVATEHHAAERSDATIRKEIERQLDADPIINIAGIFVSVSRGRVMIEGSVEDHEAKQRAEAICRQANGIVSHHTNLIVRKTQ